MVMSVHHKPLGGERIGNVIVSADVLTHAMYQHDDARARLVIMRGPAKAGELPAVVRTAGERAGVHYRGLAVAPARPRSTLSKNCCDRSCTEALPPHSAYPHIASTRSWSYSGRPMISNTVSLADSMAA